MADPSPRQPRLLELAAADSAESWTVAGFAVGEDSTVRLGDTVVRLAGRSDQARGIISWTLTGVDLTGGHLDGLPTLVISPAEAAGRDGHGDAAIGSGLAHPNGATGIDHVVVSTPDLERTIEACAAAGLDCRRIREAGTRERPLRQAFFRLGPTVLEVVSGPTGTGTTAEDGPCRWFGLAVDVADLDESAALLGPALGRIKGAVQAGRRIATVRHRDLGLSVAVALMDDRGDR